MKENDGMFDVSENLIVIAFETIQKKFRNNIRCFRVIYKDSVKPSRYLSEETKNKVKDFYKELRYETPELFMQFIQMKLEQA